jgi:hypothetical protein
MRKLIATTVVSVDGVMQAPGGQGTGKESERRAKPAREAR